jgi:antiviral helicase SKI2
MAGIIVGEAISRGPPPTVEVLNIGAPDSTRRSSDILPFMPRFRKFLAPLPRSAARMSLQVVKVSVADIECITKTVVKSHGPAWNLKIQKGMGGEQIPCDGKLIRGAEVEQVAEEELVPICDSWTSTHWDEFDWSSKIKEVQLRDILEARRRDLAVVDHSQCLGCPDFAKHVGIRSEPLTPPKLR